MKILLLAVLFTGCITTAKFSREQAVIVETSSGFRMDNYVVTANHVAKSLYVVIKDCKGNEEVGLVVARDTLNDIALIRLRKPVYTDYSTASVHIRQKVYSVSNPIGLHYSELSGEVQSLERIENGVSFIQIGIDVYYGSSGGAVFNGQGELVGLISRAIPGTRFTLIIPIQKVVLLIKKQRL